MDEKKEETSILSENQRKKLCAQLMALRKNILKKLYKREEDYSYYFQK